MYALPFLLYYFYVGEVEASGSSGAGVTGHSLYPDVGAGDRNHDFYKGSNALDC